MLALTLCLVFITSIVSQILGPAEVTLKRAEKCSKEKHGVTLDFSMKKIDRTNMAFSVYLVLPYDLDDNISVNITASKWGNGGWKPNIFDHREANFCKCILKFFPKFFNDLVTALKQPNECPLKKGVYNLTDYVIDTNLGYPAMYGEFMVDGNIIRDNEVYVCLRGFVSVAPKLIG